jgi:hypothetical protein
MGFIVNERQPEREAGADTRQERLTGYLRNDGSTKPWQQQLGESEKGRVGRKQRRQSKLGRRQGTRNRT